jgi:hypothetical protein
VTAEQVCEALNIVLRLWLEQRRQSNEVAYKSTVIRYHQRRNRAARESRQRRGAGLPDEGQGQQRRRRKRRHVRNRRRRKVASDSS